MKALGLLSGGLDSALAVRLMLDQGIEVTAVQFTSPFMCNPDKSAETAKSLKIPLIVMEMGTDYLGMLLKPKYGYGSGINPCIDCRIYCLKKAKKLANRIGAKFIFTGEVLNQRPMSQHLRALRIVEAESGLSGRLLRPLSARLLPETEAEKKGWVDRSKLLAIRGRSRKIQLEMAKKNNIIASSPGGGCLLTHKDFADKMRNLLKHKKNITFRDANLLKTGRHFRKDENKIIVGRNEGENKRLLELKNRSEYAFEVLDYVGPVTLLQGPKNKESIGLAASLTVRYSDAKEKAKVSYAGCGKKKTITAEPLSDKEIGRIRIGAGGNGSGS